MCVQEIRSFFELDFLRHKTGKGQLCLHFDYSNGQARLCKKPLSSLSLPITFADLSGRRPLSGCLPFAPLFQDVSLFWFYELCVRLLSVGGCGAALAANNLAELIVAFCVFKRKIYGYKSTAFMHCPLCVNIALFVFGSACFFSLDNVNFSCGISAFRLTTFSTAFVSSLFNFRWSMSLNFWDERIWLPEHLHWSDLESRVINGSYVQLPQFRDLGYSIVAGKF